MKNETESAGRFFGSLNNFKQLYTVPTDDVSNEIIIPLMKLSDDVSIMTGYFSAQSIKELSQGLIYYLHNSKNKLKILVSSQLTEEELMLVEDQNIDMRVIDELKSTINECEENSDIFIKHTLDCISYLVNTNRIEIKVVLMRSGIFHAKTWIFEDSDKKTAVLSGSANFTMNGLQKNYEQLWLTKSWDNNPDAYKKLKADFENFWFDNSPISRTITLDDKILENLIKNRINQPPTVEDYENMLKNEFSSINAKPEIPDFLLKEDKRYGYRDAALKNWAENNYQGVLSIVTGGGKTITAIIGAINLYKKKNEKLTILVTVPNTILQDQWDKELKIFNIKSKICDSSKKTQEKYISEIKKSLLIKQVGELDAFIITHDFLKNDNLLRLINKFSDDILLVADEVHGLGVATFTKKTPGFKYVLGLSATPKRFDDSETNEIYNIFGKCVFEYGIKDAISNGCLVKYNYRIIKNYLNMSEMGLYLTKTAEINKISSIMKNDDFFDPDNGKKLTTLQSQRQDIVEAAEEKINNFKKLLEEEMILNGSDCFMYTLIFSSSKNLISGKDDSQFKKASRVLSELNLKFRELTGKETGSGIDSEIIENFKKGETHFLNSMKVLQEGFNIPRTEIGIFLGSGRNPREWVQKRGRVLRTYNDGKYTKEFATIIDFITLPTNEMINDYPKESLKIIDNELERIHIFYEDSEDIKCSDNETVKIINELIDLKLNISTRGER